MTVGELAGEYEFTGLVKGSLFCRRLGKQTASY